MRSIRTKTNSEYYTNPSSNHQFSRRDFLKVSITTIGSLGVTLAGCSIDNSFIESIDSYIGIIDNWIKAVNSEDVDQFENLHTESVIYNSNLEKQPYVGRNNIWESFRLSNAGALEKTYMFGYENMVCLQVTAVDTKRSFLYVFNFEQNLISHVYEYSGKFDLSVVPLFDGADITTDNTGLQERINTIDSQVAALNNRDFSRFIETFNEDSILYIPLSKVPVIGTENIFDDVQSFTEYYPNVELSIFRTFGHGNLICQQLAVKNGPMRSLGFVNLFNGDKVSRVYEYLSSAELIS